MQDLIETLLSSRSEKITAAVDKLCTAQPGYVQARQRYDEAAEKIAGIVGFELFDELETNLLRLTDYERDACYRFGLGLREELVRRLGI